MKFSIRDLLLVTVVVGLIIAWWIDHRQQNQKVDAATAWRHRAGALEEILTVEGWKVTWKETKVSVEQGGNYHLRGTIYAEPSAITVD